MTILSIRIDIIWQSHRSNSSASACLLSFDHLQMPAMAGLISNLVGMTALYGLLCILLCFEFVPPPNLVFFTLVFVLPRPPPFFAGPIICFVRKFLSDIWSGRLAFFVGHFEKMSICPTSPTNFDSTEIYEILWGQIKKYVCFRFPDRPYFFLPTLRLFIVWVSNHQNLEIDSYVFLLKVVWLLVSYACKALHKQSAVLIIKHLEYFYDFTRTKVWFWHMHSGFRSI